MKVKAEKKIVSSRAINAGGFTISAEAVLSLLVPGEGIFLSLSPVAILVDTGSGLYRFDLKKELFLPEEPIQTSAPQSG